MDKQYQFAIIGCGNGGMALAGQIASKGYKVNIYEGLQPTEAFLKLSQEKKIFLHGDITACGNLNMVTTDLEAAVRDAEVILIAVPAFAHEPVFQKLVHCLKDGHKIVIIPGNFGSLLLRKMMLEAGVQREVSISELASLPYACRISNYNTVEIYGHKKKLKMATWPTKCNPDMLQIMNELMDMFFQGKNVLEVSLDNINSVLHPLPVLLNIGAIEKNSAQFRHYIDGISPSISENIQKMDLERLAIGSAYSLDLIPTLEQLKMYYGSNGCETVYEFVNSEQSPYKNIWGQNIGGRYLTEDVPYLLVPAMQLGLKAGVDLPLFRICIQLASLLHGKDYEKSGHGLNTLGVEGLSREALIEYVN